jgi:integrase
MPPTERGGGRRLTIDAFHHMMGDAIKTAGLPDDVITHGLRYTAAMILHEIGCEWETIASITGHETVSVVKKYTEKRRRSRLTISELDDAGTAKETTGNEE